jgi:hypothetical protein
MDNPDTYPYIGGAIYLLFLMSYKLLRNRSIMIIALIMSLTLVLVAFNFRYIESLQLKNANATNWLFTPIFFLTIYTIGRIIFKSIYKYEPILSDLRPFYWGREEGRKLHFADFVFTITMFSLPIVLTVLL